MKLPFAMNSAMLGAILLLPACQNEDEEWRDEHGSTTETYQEPQPNLPEGNINACDQHGSTALAQVSEELREDMDDLRDAEADEDAEMCDYYREAIAKKKAQVREHLRAGADPWARSLSQSGALGPCARQYWPQDFVEELRNEGFDISDTPITPANSR